MLLQFFLAVKIYSIASQPAAETAAFLSIVGSVTLYGQSLPWSEEACQSQGLTQQTHLRCMKLLFLSSPTAEQNKQSLKQNYGRQHQLPVGISDQYVYTTYSRGRTLSRRREKLLCTCFHEAVSRCCVSWRVLHHCRAKCPGATQKRSSRDL